jgi:hypothetical protein
LKAYRGFAPVLLDQQRNVNAANIAYRGTAKAVQLKQPLQGG